VLGPTTALSITRELSIISATGKALHVYTKWTEDESDQNSGTLISKSLVFHRRLPDYHPKYLTELLMHEEYDKVKKILIHLAFILNEEEIKFIKYPLLKLMKEEEKVQKQIPIRNNLLSKYSTISYEDEEHSTDEEEEQEEVKIEKKEEKKETKEEEKTMEFPKAYKILLTKLSNVQLPEINRVDQMHLIALINAFNTIQEKPGALDEGASRYLISYRIFLNQSKNNPDITLKYSHVAWAMQSTTQDTLLNLCIPPGTKYTWELIKNSGLIYWVQNTATLVFKQIN
jgi:hypothetical protein